MRLLLDANPSPALVAPLTRAGHDVVHVQQVGLVAADDQATLDHAAADRRVIITAHSDFPMLLAPRRAIMPSVVLLRHVTHLPPDAHRALLQPTCRSYGGTWKRARWCRSARHGRPSETFRSPEESGHGQATRGRQATEPSPGATRDNARQRGHGPTQQECVRQTARDDM